MSQIGCFGSLIVFETSDYRVLNFNNFQRTVSANWGTHERVGLKPLSEFLGAKLQTLTFTMTLDAQLGVRPRRMIASIESSIESGDVQYLVIGAARVGRHRWKITQMSEAWGVVMNRGELQRATVSLTLEEYL
jgi:hypothetical protein